MAGTARTTFGAAKRRLPRVPGTFARSIEALAPKTPRGRRALQLSLCLVLVLLSALASTATALGSTVSSAGFSGGAGTVSVGGTLYAKSGGALTLTVNTSADTQCVDVTGAFTAHQQSASAKSSWTFGFTAGTGDGPQTVTVAASPNFNAQNNRCTGSSGSGTASFTLDNTAPAVTSALSPAPNAAGWNNQNVGITWSATDTGSGVGSGPTPATDSVSGETSGVTKTSSALDRLGNSGSSSVTVKLDKTAPTITGSQSPAANGNGWNNTNVTVSFSCSDTRSGIKSCSGPTTLTTEGQFAPVIGTAVDNADNSNTATVGSIKIDKTAPALSGAPTTAPNANGWYNGNVTIHWTASDNIGGSGLTGTPADSTISGEGSGLTASASVSDLAGNTTNATSAPAVRIDRTAPNTTATAPANWNNSNVTVLLNASDALSGVDQTFYNLDGAGQQTGTSVVISSEGDHVLQFWSVDKAGNVEATKTVHVKIDKTPPTINHTQSPLANANGWNNSDVTVTFTCADTLSGVASCTTPQTVTTEGQNQAVTGTATDNAGNTATDPAKVSIDKTPPLISAALGSSANAFGWFNHDAVVHFTCTDALSGIDTCPADATLGEGAGQSASGSAHDAAGNTATASVTGVNVDETPPTLTGAATTAPNANGWYNGDVTVHWTPGDLLSGLDSATVPTDSVVTGEGNALSASASVSDRAGNSTTASVTGIRIDRSAPNTTASYRAPDFNGWYAGSVDVTLTGFDGLSGVAVTYYTVDGGAPQTYAGTFTFGTGGTHTIRYWSVDKADNVEQHADDAHAFTLRLDNIDPSIAGSRTPSANVFDWNNSPVTVSFSCSDSETGVDPAACPAPTVVSTEGANQSVTGTTSDRAGNSASDSVGDINVDLTPPTVTGAPTTPANLHGWYNGDVVVHWTAHDALSGVDTTPGDTTVVGEGSNLSTGVVHAYDKAGNQGDGVVSGIQIDRTAPHTEASIPTDAASLKNGWYTGPVTVSLLGSDGLSGVEATYFSVDDGPAQTYTGSFQVTGGGTHTVKFWSVDNAGNVEDANGAGNSLSFKIDNIAPTIHGARSAGSEANPFGWNNGPVGVFFTCNDAETGVKTCLGATTVSGEGEDQSVQGTATDYAGNTASDTVDHIDIDLTKPTLSGAPTTSPNAAGWYNGDVTVHWTPFDALSGVNPATAPADTTVTGEGDNLAAGPVTVFDRAGNESDPASVTGLKIDRTAPAITGGATEQPNANGWYSHAVTIGFSCTDNLSGVASCPSEQSISGNGADQGVTSASAFDNAGNEASGIHVGGINVDGAPPSSSAALVCDINNGFCRGTTATVNLSATDQAGLSGVAAIHYSVDGGAEQVVAGNTANVDLPLNGSGTGTVTYYAVDRADNKEPANSSTVKWDNIAPVVTHTITPVPNAAGWDNADTTVHFHATDDFSGVASITGDVLVSLETAGLDVPGHATDTAGNTGSDTAHVMLDATPPSIVGSRATGSAASGFGWNNGPVTVQFACSDALSGIAVCADPSTVTGEGDNQTVTGTATDKADNTASATVDHIRIDLTPPELSGAATTAPNANGWYHGDVTVHWTASDALSGVATAPADSLVTGEGDNLSASASASDQAGNSQSATVAGIKIDRVPPMTFLNVPDPLASGWYAHGIDVTLDAHDNLSGVDKTYYAVDGGTPNVYADAFHFDDSGVHDLTYWSVDNAGNAEVVGHQTIKIDNVPPVITGAQSPGPNAFGWNNTDVTVHYDCHDAESDIAYCSPDQPVVNEGAGQSATGTATDNAGNTSSATVAPINIDKTKPSLVGVATAPPNAAGWYKGDVTVDWQANDALSGIDATTVPAPVTITGEGNNLSTPSVKVSDQAGNEQTASYGGVNIDRTAPTITATKDAANAAGWYNHAVTVRYDCADALSGVASCPADSTLSSDGANQTVTSDTARDMADNVAAGVTTTGINIDSQAPQSVATQSCGSGNDWCQSTATVHITATDQAGLSGVQEIHYAVDGGAVQVVAGDSATVNLTLSSTGSAAVKYWAVDKAGNVEGQNGVSIKYDNLAPTVTHSLSPAANAAQWNNANTLVHFDATDDLGGSGVDPTTVTPDQVYSSETGGLLITGHATDYAHNTGTDQLTLKLDKTPPTLNGAPTTSPNGNGWYHSAVAVHFACGDNLSGIATCPTDTTLTSNGANQSVSGTAVDKAGNQTNATVGGINIDSLAPSVGFTGIKDGGLYVLGAVPTPGCAATDAGSGLTAPCQLSVTGGLPNGVGTYTATASATDKAGNATTITASYRVIYNAPNNVPFFLQPINDTGHTVSSTVSIFKAGQTVPVKFQLKDASGKIVQSNSTPIFLTPVKGNATTSAVNESSFSALGTSGTTFRFDSSGQQYIYNWNTASGQAGFYWKIGVLLDDGQTYNTNIGLRG